MSQMSDVSMGDAPGVERMSTAQLNKMSEELLAADPNNDRLEDGLATDGFKQPAPPANLPPAKGEAGPSKKKSGK